MTKNRKMKKIYWLFLMLLTLGFGACTAEVEEILFQDKNASVAFMKEALEIDEDDEAVQVLEVEYLTSSSEGVSVDFDIVTEGIENPAVEGVDFELVNTSKTMNFGPGTYKNAVRIKVIGNDIVDANRQIKIKLTSNSLDLPLGLADGLKSEILITILNNDIEVDESHPLAELFGFYTQDDYDLTQEGAPLDPNSGNSVTILPDPEDETQVILMNFWGIGEDVEIKASVDLETKSMSILPGQVLFVHETYGACKAVAYDRATESWDWTLPISCEIGDDKNITTNIWAAMVEAGYFGVYQTVLRKK
jgi:Calx-beta domain.